MLTTAGVASQAATAGAVPSTFAPLARPLFRWLWIASLGSNVGTWMQNVAASWLKRPRTSVRR
jgi:hypothetical protein